MSVFGDEEKLMSLQPRQVTLGNTPMAELQLARRAGVSNSLSPLQGVLLSM